MCKGISILKARLNRELLEEYELAARIRTRQPAPVQTGMFDEAAPSLPPSSQEELHFMYTDKIVQLPVMHDGQLVIYEWGNRGNKQSKLYQTGWCKEESLASGKWRWLAPEPVIIPADFGIEKGVWFAIEQGVRGVVVRDEQERPHVYMLTTSSSHYFQTMTKHDRMPVLVDQQI